MSFTAVITPLNPGDDRPDQSLPPGVWPNPPNRPGGVPPGWWTKPPGDSIWPPDGLPPLPPGWTPPGIWPPVIGGGPVVPPQPPDWPIIWPQPPDRPGIWPGTPGQGLPEPPPVVGGGPILPPIIWPPLPPDVGIAGKAVILVWVVGVGYRWLFVSAGHPANPLPPTEPQPKK